MDQHYTRMVDPLSIHGPVLQGHGATHLRPMLGVVLQTDGRPMGQRYQVMGDPWTTLG